MMRKGFSDLEKLSKKGSPPGKCGPQEELGSNWRKVAEGGLELGLQGQVTRHTWGQWRSTCMGRAACARELSVSCSRPCGDRECEEHGSSGSRESPGARPGTFLTPLSLPREGDCRHTGRWLGESVCPRGGEGRMPGHAAGQGQASPGSSPLPPIAFPERDQSEANRGGSPGEESSRGSTISIHTQLRPQTRVRARPRMGGKGGRMSPVLNAFTIVCHHPGAGPSA